MGVCISIGSWSTGAKVYTGPGVGPFFRFSLHFLVTIFFTCTGVAAQAAEEVIRTSTGETRRVLTVPALIKIGSAGDQVRELQATLNEKLGGQTIALPLRSEIGPILDHGEVDKKTRVRKLLLIDGRDLRIRADWSPCDALGNIIDEEALPGNPDEPCYLHLPVEKPQAGP